MYTYYWYLMHKKDFPEFLNEPGDWVLVCPDFPGICISDAELDTKTWRDTKFLNKAKDIVTEELLSMYSTGATVPSGQDRLLDYFSFRVVVPDREPSSPSHPPPVR